MSIQVELIWYEDLLQVQEKYQGHSFNKADQGHLTVVDDDILIESSWSNWLLEIYLSCLLSNNLLHEK